MVDSRVVANSRRSLILVFLGVIVVVEVGSFGRASSSMDGSAPTVNDGAIQFPSFFCFCFCTC